MAKDLHWPSISPRKKRELLVIKKHLQSRNKPIKVAQSQSNNAMIVKKPPIPDLKLNRYRKSRNTQRKWEKSMYTEMLEKQRMKNNSRIKYKNYMYEFKKQQRYTFDSDLEPQMVYENPYYDWKTIENKTNMEDKDKVVLMKEKAQMMQEKAERKEEYALIS